MASSKQDEGYNVLFNRGYKATPDYSQPFNMRFGINQPTTITGAETDLDFPIPILDGTVNDDGNNQLIGATGGDNSTDNTTTFKPGAGVTDNTSQNLIANNSSTLKIWTIADLSINGNVIDITKYCGFWIYIKDSTTLDKFRTTSFSLQLKLGSNSSNTYFINIETSNLSTGWNWITDSDIVGDWSTDGTPAGNIDYFKILIVTKNATDTFIAGDVVFDLLRQWERSDTILAFDSGYPSFDEIGIDVLVRSTLNTTQAVGFNINAMSIENTDTPPKMTDLHTFDADSKSDTDEFVFTDKTGK